jgi:hypothetical protein
MRMTERTPGNAEISSRLDELEKQIDATLIDAFPARDPFTISVEFAATRTEPSVCKEARAEEK